MFEKKLQLSQHLTILDKEIKNLRLTAVSLFRLSLSLFFSLSFSLSSLFFSRVCNMSLCISLFLIWCFYVLYFLPFIFLSRCLSLSVYFYLSRRHCLSIYLCVPLSVATSLSPSIFLLFLSLLFAPLVCLQLKGYFFISFISLFPSYFSFLSLYRYQVLISLVFW